mmetsp:Transcript_8731/g.28561  ORF Transcript_8731/g.28561 Transcript_8731/m.28561 type:complete len:148 (-) Transcript_8731:90-533(-)
MAGLLARLSFNDVLRAHSIIAGACGLALVFLPHRIFGWLFSPSDYSHVAHEFGRCYGAVLTAQSWLTLRTRAIADARIRRLLAESYAVAYGLTAVALLRASIAAPRLHGLLGLVAALCSAALSALYAYFRFLRKLKTFELPGGAPDD